MCEGKDLLNRPGQKSTTGGVLAPGLAALWDAAAIRTELTELLSILAIEAGPASASAGHPLGVDVPLALHASNNIAVCVRSSKKDPNGQTAPYTFIGLADYVTRPLRPSGTVTCS